MLNPEISAQARDFFDMACDKVALEGSHDWLGHLLDLKREAVLAKDVRESQIQDAALFRSRRRAVILANWIIDESGSIDKERLGACLEAFVKHGHVFYAQGRSDKLIHEHTIRILKTFIENPAIFKTLMRFSRPVCHRYAENLIRKSLFLGPTEPLQNCHVRRAVLSACLTLLRQNVGSCFATAPALRIQREQLEYFLQDMHEILATGRLKRVREGIEYGVPLSPSFGMGDLRRDLVSLRNFPLFRSPALQAACRAAGMISDEEEQEFVLKKWLDAFDPEKEGSIAVIDFFEVLIRREHGVSKEEWKAFCDRRVAPRRIGMFNGVSARDEVCEKLDTALSAFKETFVAFVDHPLLKAWEFTLASFSESKAEFSKWNLYASLGLDPRERGGIGQLVAAIVDTRLDNANEKVEELQKDYEIAFDQVRATEALLRQVDSHEKARRLQAEYQSRVYHMHSLLDKRDETHRKGKEYASLLSFLVKQYELHFPQFFQEIYDVEMFDPQMAFYQDSMAGFRLVYKHGRNDPSQWTMIHDATQYVESLIDFFKMTETAIAAAYPYPEVSTEIVHITDQIIAHLRTSIFIETAMERIKRAHSLEHLPGHSPDMLLGEKTPWAYISGGTVETLLTFYYRYPSVITSESRWVESGGDLLVFLLDALKGLPFRQSEYFAKQRDRGMLMHSPNHAFVLYPGWPEFFTGWQDSGFTYTWVRDRIISPGREFFSSILLSIEEQLFLVQEWLKRFSPLLQHQAFRAFPTKTATRSVHDFVRVVSDVSKEALGELEFVAQLDSYLYEMLPLCPGNHWKKNVLALIPEIWRDKVGAFLHQEADDLGRFLGSKELQELAKGYCVFANGSVQMDADLHKIVAENARKLRLAPPSPLLFADSNWPHFLFGFMWGAASERLRLWRFDANDCRGSVMKEWEDFVEGKRQQPKHYLPWGIYTKLEQYS